MSRGLPTLGGALAVGLALGAGWLAVQLRAFPDLSPWEARYELPAAPPVAAGTPRVTLTYLGVATLVISDGHTTLLTDGFFTRVGKWALLTDAPIEPDVEAIEHGLARAGVEKAAAVLVVHSHFDHSMDAPEVARRTGAVVVGSRSTANVARGWGLPGGQILEVEPERPYGFGTFRVTFLPSRHVPLPFGAGDLGTEIERPLSPPCPASAYREGGAWSIVIEHELGSLLVQGSAGWEPGALRDVRVDAVALGIGNLWRQGEAYREQYYREVVEAVDAGRVLPIHYDDFTLGPGVIRPAPPLFGDVRATVDWLAGKQPSLALLPPWQEVVLFGE